MKKPVDQIKAAKKAIRDAKKRNTCLSLCQKCAEAGLMPPVMEYRFHESRKWRFDYAWPEVKVALEVDGGIFINGGHNRGAQMLKTWEKEREAAILGWRFLRYQPSDLLRPSTINDLLRILPHGTT